MSGWTHRRRRQRRRQREVNLREALWAVVRRQIPPADLRLIRLREKWRDIAGPTLARRAYPAKIYGGTVVVHVSNDQWRHELEYLRPALMARLSQADRGLHTLEVRRGDLEPPEPPPEPLLQYETAESRAAAWTGLAGEPPRETFDALMSVQDPELRDSLAATRMLLAQAGPSKADPEEA